MDLESFLLRTLRPDFGSHLVSITGMFGGSTPLFLRNIYIYIYISNLTKIRE